MSFFVIQYAFYLGLGLFTFHMTFLFLRKILGNAGIFKKKWLDDVYNHAPVIFRTICLALFTIQLQKSHIHWMIWWYMVCLNLIICCYTLWHYYNSFQTRKYLSYVLPNLLLLIFYVYTVYIVISRPNP